MFFCSGQFGNKQQKSLFFKQLKKLWLLFINQSINAISQTVVRFSPSDSYLIMKDIIVAYPNPKGVGYGFTLVVTPPPF